MSEGSRDFKELESQYQQRGLLSTILISKAMLKGGFRFFLSIGCVTEILHYLIETSIGDLFIIHLVIGAI